MKADGHNASPHKGFALYVHWPFCLKKCPYCDFNSHVRDSVDHENWADSLVQDLRHQAGRSQQQPLTSIFFGGGTPSLMSPATVQRIIDSAQNLFGFSNRIEITLEANPTSVERERFAAYRIAGVNRLSLGVQALDDEALQFLGRQHSVAEALAALEVAQSTFDRVSFDLIYARAGQTIDDWQAELARALSFGTDHLSLYQLTIEPQTEFGKRHAMGQLPLIEDDLAADMFDLTRAQTEAAGLPAYETSNHAKPDQESRHNLTYWQGGTYFGIGPGAHGRLSSGAQRTATEAVRTPERWLEAVERNGHGLNVQTKLTASEQTEERLMMGLRLTTGVPLADIDQDVLDQSGLKIMMDEGFIEIIEDHLRLTRKGTPLLNAVLGRIISAEN